MAVEKLLTYEEVAELLGVSSRTVYTLARRGDLQSLKVGNSNRVDPSDLRRFIEQSKVRTARSDCQASAAKMLSVNESM